ncbi:uncharacterized protein MELLADRAFT_89949 [Melampsora larici-populina 98AG31]|uniref:Monooxygenase n=1 Tax=Melampsora larici-populina (strain 98AG31 / pathotype 3-4-7) TaxID=747676 RepID=F4RV75_MELLP|nr:uncharacterized protein MELLADRAFT_89949 [Melampsora larici-populina 98AG31]EGG03716.1 hypothetical protein MELLADRAFT_89949 [Melampsora larici-populina 98AG31]
MRQEEIECFGISAQPTVMIIGAGQSGLMLAARLKLLGLSTLIVDKNQRTGDSWRKRYHSLCLHDPIWADHFPYMSYPDNWPIYMPKDKLAGWFEYYAEAMELSIWNESTVQQGSSSYDPTTGTWSVEVIRPTGSRTLHPRFLVMATGLNGAPRWPDNFPMDSFTGTLVHSSAFNTGEEWKGKHAVVIGACNSAHDIAAELWVNGAASVTMVQRSNTYVMSSEHGLKGLLKGSYEEDGPAIQDADLGFTSLPLNLLEKIHTKATEETTRLDHSLLESLKNVGFKLDPCPAGLLMKFFRKGGGYYIDVGCSALLAERKIQLKQGVEVEELTPHGVKFADGEEIEADLVVCATGYSSFHDTIRSILGPQVSEKLGPIWGADSQGELPGVWRLSGHPAFWVMCGNLTLARCFSKHVATQILLQELGLCDKNFSGRLGKSYFKEGKMMEDCTDYKEKLEDCML